MRRQRTGGGGSSTLTFTIAITARRVVVLALGLALMGACSSSEPPEDGGSDLVSGDALLTDDMAMTPDAPRGTPDAAAPDGTTPDGGGLPDVATPDAPGGGPDGTGSCNMGSLEMDLSEAGIVEFVTSGAYQCWVAEPAVHPSAGPHGNTAVRTFFNDVIAASLRAGNQVHPAGSMLVKELYGPNGIIGFAMDVKLRDGTTADTWLFYEGFAPSFRGYYGEGLPLCANCHVAGVDYVRSAFPKK